MAAVFRPRQIRSLTVAATALLVLVGGPTVEVVVQQLRPDSFPRWLQDLIAIGALAAIPVAVVTAWLWHSLRIAAVPEMDELDRRRAVEEARVQRGLARRERIRDVLRAGDSLSVVFQPVIDLTSGEVVGHEALSRFGGPRGPEEWFAEAHAVGLGLELELLAVRRALDVAQPFGGRVSVNASPSTLCSPQFVELLRERMTGSVSVTVEITEHAAVEDYEQVRAAQAELHALGVELAVDDAGGGYSSMRHIIDLSPDVIKLDRTLVAAMDGDPARRSLAMSLVRFAREMNAELVAEGIERPEELQACREVGIHLGQGYLLGRPGPLQPEPA